VVGHLTRRQKVNPGGNEKFSGRIQRDRHAFSGEVNAGLGAHGAEWRFKPPFHSLEFSLHTSRIVRNWEYRRALWKKKYKIDQIYEKSM
jgi:hypothetical protein